MRISVTQGALETRDAELIVVYLFEGATQPAGAAAAVDEALGGQLGACIAAGDIKGKRGEATLLYRAGRLVAQRVLVVGLGKKEEFCLEAVRHAAGVAAQRARDLGLSCFTTVCPDGTPSSTYLAQALVEGAMLALYSFWLHKTEGEKPVAVDEMTIVESDASRVDALRAGVRVGQIIAQSVYLTRDLVNEPANFATPAILAERARAVALDAGLAFQALEKSDMQELGMGALLGVNQGSDEPPRLIILEHNPGRSLPTVVLVGKGITFDSGGISLKPGEDMHKMKDDMAGGAAVLGALRAAALLNLPLHVVGLIPATENMPSGKATRPGDVLVSMSGKTIEVQNTDAEGRLILADALTYAERYQPSAVIDIATLTGACVVALGSITTGLLSNDDRLSDKLISAGEKTFERVWRLPLFKEYGEQIKSDVADIRNVGGRPAGTITAGLFLGRFAESYPWAHLDIAGTSWVDKPTNSYLSVGGSGVGVRLFVELLRAWA